MQRIVILMVMVSGQLYAADISSNSRQAIVGKRLTLLTLQSSIWQAIDAKRQKDAVIAFANNKTDFTLVALKGAIIADIATTTLGKNLATNDCYKERAAFVDQQKLFWTAVGAGNYQEQGRLLQEFTAHTQEQKNAVEKFSVIPLTLKTAVYEDMVHIVAALKVSGLK